MRLTTKAFIPQLALAALVLGQSFFASAGTSQGFHKLAAGAFSQVVYFQLAPGIGFSFLVGSPPQIRGSDRFQRIQRLAAIAFPFGQGPIFEEIAVVQPEVGQEGAAIEIGRVIEPVQARLTGQQMAVLMDLSPG